MAIVNLSTLSHCSPVSSDGSDHHAIPFFSATAYVTYRVIFPDFDTFFTKPLILLESKNKLGTTLKVSVDYLIR